MNSAVKTPWIKVTQVAASDLGVLQAVWENGESATLDIRSLLECERFWRLRNIRYFRQVSLDQLGGICWPEGEDLAPDGLDRYRK